MLGFVVRRQGLDIFNILTLPFQLFRLRHCTSSTPAASLMKKELNDISLHFKNAIPMEGPKTLENMFV